MTQSKPDKDQKCTGNKTNTYKAQLKEVVETTHEGKNKKARPRFELGISSLLVRRFNQLSHRAVIPHAILILYKLIYRAARLWI